MTYGLPPSVYDDEVFGLEEDYLFYGMACWGMTGPAWEAFAATYLTDAHQAPGHYLHDLRCGLTPWQAARLLKMGGRGPESLSEAQLERLRAMGRWVVAQRAQTRGAGALEAEGGAVRIYEGLLPPSRYGGDLDFPTQSLSTSAACCAGLFGLAWLDGEDGRWREEAEAMLAALEGAFEAVRQETPHGVHLPLHTGGGEPGDYHQLMAWGIVAPLELWPSGGEIVEGLDRWSRRAGRHRYDLPRFDAWGAHGPGVDAHYAVGHLLTALRTGRREEFWGGLLGLVGVMDPEVFTFREVAPVQAVAPPWGHEGTVPGRHLARSEPCVGSLGVALQLVRHALVTELPVGRGAHGRTLRVLAGALPGWWAQGQALRFGPAPTTQGAVSLEARREGEVVRVRVSAPAGCRVEVVAPTIEGRTLVGVSGEAWSGSVQCPVLEGGRGELCFEYRGQGGERRAQE